MKYTYTIVYSDMRDNITEIEVYNLDRRDQAKAADDANNHGDEKVSDIARREKNYPPGMKKGSYWSYDVLDGPPEKAIHKYLDNVKAFIKLGVMKPEREKELLQQFIKKSNMDPGEDTGVLARII